MPSSSDRVTEECREAHEHFATFPRKRMVMPILFEALDFTEGSEHFLNSITERQKSRLCLKFRQTWIDGHRKPCTWIQGSSEKCGGTRDYLRSQLNKCTERLLRIKKESWQDLSKLSKLENVHNHLKKSHDLQKKVLEETEGKLQKTGFLTNKNRRIPMKIKFRGPPLAT